MARSLRENQARVIGVDAGANRDGRLTSSTILGVGGVVAPPCVRYDKRASARDWLQKEERTHE
jgi:hypothetical protein